MQATEALTRLIAAAEARLNLNESRNTERVEQSDHEQQLELATAICQAMLNTAIPVARFRALIELQADQPRRSKWEDFIAAKQEFTISAVNMKGILGGLGAITNVPTGIRLSIWEQRQTGVDMVSGYEGQTKTAGYRQFLLGLAELEFRPDIPTAQ